MRLDVPLDTVLDPDIRQFVGHSPQLSEGLSQLQALLGDPKGKLSSARLSGSLYFSPILRPEQVPLAEELYWQVVARGGAGSQGVREGLLVALAMTGAGSSLPFWERVLEHSIPRDQFRKRQQVFAVAGIACAARYGDSVVARQRLDSLASSHPEPSIQALAVRGLWLHREDALPDDVVALLEQLSVEQPRFLQRHAARRGLKTAQRPVPLDNGVGSYVFQLQLGRGRQAFTASVELASSSSLHALHLAIQDALRWDADHLYIFSVTSDPADPAGVICGLNPYGEPFDEDDLPNTRDWRIGELGLASGDKLTYLFDFGDRHRFDIQLTELRVLAEGELPRVLARKGKPPSQYR